MYKFHPFFKAPSDDGGSPVTQYKVEMRDVDRRSWNDVGQFDEEEHDDGR